MVIKFAVSFRQSCYGVPKTKICIKYIEKVIKYGVIIVMIEVVIICWRGGYTVES